MWGFPEMRYDVIIVGGGSAGCTLAARLSEDPECSVLLLEAGPDYPNFQALPDELKFGYNNAAAEPDSPFNWAYQAIGSPRQSRRLDIARGKVIGGSGSVNGQVFLRGLPEDYDAWAAQGNDEWSYEKTLPFFRKLESDLDIHDDFHGADGPVPVRRLAEDERLPVYQAFLQAALNAGFPYDPDMNHPETSGAGAVPMNNPNNIRMSAALAYLNPARHRLNLTIRTGAAVRRVVFYVTGAGKLAEGVEVESNGETFYVFGRQVVLCAGGIASPHLLLLSGIGPEIQLRAMELPVLVNSPGVGKNLRDHPMALVELEPAEGVELAAAAPRIQTGLRYTAAGSHLRNDMQITLTTYEGDYAGDPIAGAGRRNARNMHFSIILELAESSGSLRLASNNPDHYPRLNYRYLQSENDLRRLREAVRLCVRLLEDPALRPLVRRRLTPTDADLESDAALDAWLHENIQTTFHSSGACKMGPDSDPLAVVDQYCRVKGIEGLWVVDLSVCPNVVRANTNATALMLAERAAPWITQQLTQQKAQEKE